MPLGDGPLYAIRAGADMLITHGGIRVNEYFQALDNQYRQVKNLYVAGVDFGGVDADEYKMCIRDRPGSAALCGRRKSLF